MTTATLPLRSRQNILPQIAAALLGGIVLFLLAVATLTVSYQLAYSGRILPGVHMAGVDLSGLPPEDAAAALSERLTYPYSGRIVFRDGEQVWVAAPAELGMVFDVGASVQDAYGVGRRSGLFGNLAGQARAWQSGVDVPPIVIVDQRVAYAWLQNLAAQIDRPVVEADLHLNGTEIVYAPGQTGRALDLDASLANLEAALQSFRDGEVTLVIREQTPAVLDASAQAETLRGILSAPLTLSIPNPEPGDPGPWSVDASALAGMVAIVRVPAGSGESLQVTLDPRGLQPLLNEIAAQLDRDPANARFIFNDNTKQLDLKVNAVTGRSLDVAATLAAIQSALLAGHHAVPLTVASQPPAVGDDATAASLGITELVSSQITYFRGSGAARMQNIEIAGSQFHGLLIAPGETFSMGDVLGDVSLENGYAEALIIYNGRTITGVGGGVCQVSTTLFRTAFFGGYPIVERTPHAYRVYYYEQTVSGYDNNLAGLDATVYFPLVDFKFTNDRPYWLLMEVYVNKSAQRITWKFYSTSDGRSVDWTTTGPLNVVPAPAPLYQMNASLGKDEIDQIDWAADGADITVTRTVTRGGALFFTDTFRTHYQPWQAICEYGPGTDNWAGLAKDLGLCQPR
ncbi:MAG: hypothetical protein FD146_1506 [Anaerolineaceae bacterium]|nr:MAG: hypothetical protein FD146_1506 [Anaerolineaceae bacterium]